ncbi:VOC family protein [Streptomyces sp. NPDC021096]|uniref:VOC family protein n=1 Tax=Streptomyces sp. NPDC021096 TaxID=3154792 RepID=UPI0033D41D23
MAAELNHVIVHCKDRHASAAFVAELLGTKPPADVAIFTQITTSNGVDIDFADSVVAPENLNNSHLAFLVTEEEFDTTFAKITERSLPHWADPYRTTEGINHNDGGRGVYVLDPGGTIAVEFLTVPYGGRPKSA